MDPLIYGLLFWVFAAIFIGLETTGTRGTPWATLVKAVPAILAASFAFLSGSSNSFPLLLALSLVFCALGDIGMEYDILPGLGLFLISHICYIATFAVQSTALGITLFPLAGFLVCVIVLLVYVSLYHRYLQTSETPTPLIRAVDLYAIALSLTASSSLLLWLASGTFLGFLPFLGALLFITSDSLIGIKEFHHHFDHEEQWILGTYYLAIFLLSLSALIYAF
ncbi:lysoplasmalogenase [Candidatus Thorarchaeota archaeon]|nr:MAG: lysoplasmalogenase [Candidatus Thorarchaeota archaeon]